MFLMREPQHFTCTELIEQKKLERTCWPGELSQDPISNANMTAMRTFELRSTFALHTRMWDSETLCGIRFFKNMHLLFM
jgi:hypothetical protein